MSGSTSPSSASADAGASGPTSADHEITRLLDQLGAGDEAALDRLLPLVYDELRKVAQRQLRRRGGHDTLNTTSLVHEAYMKLAGRTVAWADRAHFFGVAALAMRQILINQAHKHATAKRGGRWRRLPLDETVLSVEEQADVLLALDEALTRLAALNARLSRVVEYRFFGGMTEEEVAKALGVSDRTVRRDWIKARLWLYAELVDDATG
jgi:RNA polymerase sigma factor (TIGR02999 family)